MLLLSLFKERQRLMLKKYTKFTGISQTFKKKENMKIKNLLFRLSLFFLNIYCIDMIRIRTICVQTPHGNPSHIMQ